MSNLWVSLQSQLVWMWKSFTVTEYLWAAIALFAIGWLHCSREN